MVEDIEKGLKPGLHAYKILNGDSQYTRDNIPEEEEIDAALVKLFESVKERGATLIAILSTEALVGSGSRSSGDPKVIHRAIIDTPTGS